MWEYRLQQVEFTREHSDILEIEEGLNRDGADNWELVNIIPAPGGSTAYGSFMYLILKREI
jgi:hypothetical protein